MRSANGETRGIRPDITGTLTYTGGTASVTNADIEAKSFAIRTGTSVPDSLSVGAAVMGSVNFTLLNTNGKYDNVVWKGATFTFTLTVVNGNVTNNFPMGTYYVVSHSESGDRIQVQCYDAMKILDEYEIYEDIQNYNLFPNGNPSSIQLIVDSILTQHHNLSYTGLVNPTTGVINPRNDHMSERQLLSYIAQLNGQYIIIRPNAQGTPVVHFEWYDTTTTYDAGTTFSHDLRTNNITITGVKVTAYSGDFSATAGTTDNMIEIEGNPLIVASNCQFFCNRIYSAVNGLTFRPGTVEIRGTPVIEAGDCLIVQTGQESNIKTLVTNLTYTLDLTIQSTADAPPYEGDLNLMRSKYIKNSAKQAISEELNDPNSELAQALGGGGGTVVHFPRVVLNDKQNPEDDLPFTRAMGYLTLAANYGTPHSEYAPDGKYIKIEWADTECVIPPYDPNEDVHFDVTLYVNRVYGHVYGVGTGGSAFFDWMADDSSHPNDDYAVAVHAKAHYGGSSTSLLFDTVWVNFYGHCDNVGLIIPSMQIPLPGYAFDLSTGHWLSLIVTARFIDYPDEQPAQQ